MSNFKQTETESSDCSPDCEAHPIGRPQPPGSERDFLSTALGLAGIVLVTDARGLILWADKPRRDVSGYWPEELCGRFIWDLAEPAEREATKRFFEKALSGHAELATERRPTNENAPQRQANLESAVALAHNVSQPLEAIATYAQAGLLQLRKRPFDKDKLANSLERIAAQVQTAAEILREVREAR